MTLNVTPAALIWFKEEWGIQKGAFVRYFARYGGTSTIQDGYSLGVTLEEPRDPGLTVEIEGITFYMEQDDIWYLNGKDMTVDYDAKKQEITYQFS